MGIFLAPPAQRRMRILGALAVAHFIVAASLVRAQDKNPLANDSNAAKLGEFEFRANCAFCHGLGARGGGRGPDLTRAQKKHGNSEWRDAARGWHDRRGNLAGDFLHSQRASENIGPTDGKCRARQRAFHRIGGLRHVPHD
jgi:mono/diheme cytochrome c family protein